MRPQVLHDEFENTKIKFFENIEKNVTHLKTVIKEMMKDSIVIG